MTTSRPSGPCSSPRSSGRGSATSGPATARTPWSIRSRASERTEIDAIELIGAEDHAILHAQGAGLTTVEDLPLPDGIYNLFTIEDGKVTCIEDFERGKALLAAGLAAD